MTGEQVVIVIAAVVVGAMALLAALAIARTLRRAGAGLTTASERLTARAQTVGDSLATARAALATTSAQAERMLWTLGELDDRMDRATIDVRSKRVASDTLRLRLLEGRLTIARLRQLVRLMIRLSEMRRVFL